MFLNDDDDDDVNGCDSPQAHRSFRAEDERWPPPHALMISQMSSKVKNNNIYLYEYDTLFSFWE